MLRHNININQTALTADQYTNKIGVEQLEKLYLIDASIYIFRAYFALPDSLVDTNGNPANAVYGFADFLIRLLQETQPHHIAVTFDGSLTTSFRNEIYPPYKANRDLTPPELKPQFQACQELTEASSSEQNLE